MSSCCTKIRAYLICNDCGAEQKIRHEKETDPLLAAKLQDVKCRFCKSKDFSVKGK
jgi:Zn finger protein HypA/HybF involved in hydrogenase expression